MIEALRMFQYLDLKYFIFTIVSELVGGGVGRLFPGGGSSAISILFGYFLSLFTLLLKIK